MTFVKAAFITMLSYSLINFSFGQASISREVDYIDINYQYLEAPTYEIPSHYETYSISLTTSTWYYTDQENAFEKYVDEFFKLNTLKKVKFGGDVEIIIEIPEVQITSDYETMGEPNSPSSSHFVIIEYIIPNVGLTIQGHDGATIVNKTFKSVDFSVPFGDNGRYSSKEDLDEGYENVKELLYSDAEKNLVKTILEGISIKLQDYSAKNKSHKVAFQFVKKVDDYDYDDLEIAVQSVKEGLLEMTSVIEQNGYISLREEQEIFNQFENAILLWNKALEESNLSDNNARINRRITGIIHYNLAKIHTITKEYDLALHHLHERRSLGNYQTVRRGLVVLEEVILERSERQLKKNKLIVKK